jgi:hypothetical protein
LICSVSGLQMTPVLALLPAIFIVCSSTICQSVYHSLTGLYEIISLSSLGVRHLLTFHIFIFFLRTTEQNLAKLYIDVPYEVQHKRFHMYLSS